MELRPVGGKLRLEAVEHSPADANGHGQQYRSNDLGTWYDCSDMGTYGTDCRMVRPSTRRRRISGPSRARWPDGGLRNHPRRARPHRRITAATGPRHISCYRPNDRPFCAAGVRGRSSVSRCRGNTATTHRTAKACGWLNRLTQGQSDGHSGSAERHLPRRLDRQLQHLAQGAQVLISWSAMICLPEVDAG